MYESCAECSGVLGTAPRAAVRNSAVLINTRSLAQMFAVSCSLCTLLWLGCLSNTYELETIFIAQLFLPPEVSTDGGCGK